jgi:uncharacterized membrane protein YcaP (DUF421 family)
VPLDWQGLFALTVSPLELFVRGTCIYWFLILVFRFVIRRELGGVGMADILLLMILADAGQNALAGEYKTITEGVILLSTVLGWNHLLDRLAFRYRAVERLASPRALPLVRHGRVMRDNLERALITMDELMGRLRVSGVRYLHEVEYAYMESDGQVSVVRSDGQA